MHIHSHTHTHTHTLTHTHTHTHMQAHTNLFFILLFFLNVAECFISEDFFVDIQNGSKQLLEMMTQQGHITNSV